MQATNDDIESEGLQVSGESGDNKGREAGDNAIKFNVDGQEYYMSKTDLENEKKLSSTYDVNSSKEEYVEYKEN